MKIAIVQQNYHINNLEYNSTKIIKAIQQAKKQKVDIVVFSELCITGYPPQDIFFSAYYFDTIKIYLDKIAIQTKDICVIIGLPRKDKKGKIYNSAVIIENKKTKKYIDKTLLPQYDVFDEKRYFSANKKFEPVIIKGKKIAVTICEDIWYDKNIYTLDPLKEITQKHTIDFIINLSASPFDYAHLEERKKVLQKISKQYKVPLFYSNTVGCQTNLIFDGASMVVNTRGEIVKQAKKFEEDFVVTDTQEIESLKKMAISTFKILDTLNIFNHPLYIEDIYNALILGIKDYFSKTGFKKVIIGASGGIDSAVVQVLACQALGKENVIAILMPSEFSSTHSISDAKKLTEKLGNEYHIIEIKNPYKTYIETLKDIFENAPFSLAEENLQSRIRGTLLMAIANKKNYVLLNTSNKSELAMGYGTLYGDMAGGLSVLGDLFKMQVYALATYLNMKEEIIPPSILTKAPSAELRPHQKDSDSLPEYNILDIILYDLIHLQLSTNEIYKKRKIDKTTILKTQQLYHLNEYKRFQFCPILRVSNKAFGIGRRMEVISKF